MRFLARWDQHAVAHLRLQPISRRDPHPGLPVPAVDLSLPFAPLLDLVSGWSDGYTRRECRIAPLELGVWAVSRVSLAGSALCFLAGRWVGQVTVGGSGEATEG